MQTQPVVTKTLRNGTVGTVTIETRNGAICTVARMGDTEVAAHCGPYHQAPANAPAFIAAAIGPFCLTADEAAALDAAWPAPPAPRYAVRRYGTGIEGDTCYLTEEL